MASRFFELFLDKLDKDQRVIIQPHDFPDHDAVSSCYAMQYLLKQLGFHSIITYNGYVDRISLKNMIDWLSIDIRHINDVKLVPEDRIIVLDGCIGEKNVTDMPGLEVCVIDHHQVITPDFLWYEDVRPEYGSTATIMTEYFDYFGIEIPKDIATALLVGLMFDTNSFTRGLSAPDIKAMLLLRGRADQELANRIFRNQLELNDLPNFQALLNDVKHVGTTAYCILPQCSKQTLGVLGDFLLALDKIDFVVLATQHHQRTYISMRSECPKTNIADVLKKELNDKGIGFGGGHKHMAGGIINSISAQNNLDAVIKNIRAHLR